MSVRRRVIEDNPRRLPKRLLYIMGALILLNSALFTSVWMDRRYIAALTEEVVPSKDTDDRAVVDVVTEYVRSDLHHANAAEVDRMPTWQRWNYLYNPFRIGPRTALEYGGDHEGACGSSSRVMMEMLRARDIDSRFVILLNDNLKSLHTLLEVSIDGRWGTVDPLYGIVYRHADGRPASALELRDNADLFASNAKHGWEYGYGPERLETRHAYNIDKYNFRNVHYFNFGKFGSLGQALWTFLHNAFGDDAPLWIRRPNFYAYPALTTAFFVNGLAGLLASVWLLRICLRRRRMK